MTIASSPRAEISLLDCFVRLFGLDRAQNTVVAYFVLRNY